jgi:arylsulfatase A-like enzyme
VDEGVAQIVNALRDAGELENTYIFFVSDNGYVQGEHRIRGGKSIPYEESLRVPLLVRGPGVPEGEVSHDLVSNVDWASTILDVTGVRPGRRQDGTSLMPAARQPAALRGRALLIESAREDYQGVRTDRYVYVRYGGGGKYSEGEVEMYDLRRDPYQLESVHDDPEYEPARRALAALTERLGKCEGPGCEAPPDVQLAAARHDPGGGETCSGRAAVRLDGEEAGDVIDAELRLPGGEELDLGSDAVEVEVARDDDVWVRARIEMVDGRIGDIRAQLPACEDEQP